jgi:hypothetical protein
LKGLIGGVLLVLSINSVNALLGCVNLSWPSTPSPLDALTRLKVYGQMLVVAGQGIVTATCVALVEELLFRSWLPKEIEVDLGYHRGIIISGLAFSLFQRYIIDLLSDILLAFVCVCDQFPTKHHIWLVFISKVPTRSFKACPLELSSLNCDMFPYIWILVKYFSGVMLLLFPNSQNVILLYLIGWDFRSPQAIPGLWLLSLGLAGAHQRSEGSLAIPIGLRAGIMASSFVLQKGGFLTYKPKFPLWVTGTHPFQPFSGAVGFAFALVLAIFLYPRQPLRSEKLRMTIQK